MTEQFSNDDLYSIDWMKSLGQKTQKYMNFTMSEVSKEDFISDLLNQDKQWNQQEFNKKAHLKQRNKNNAKNYRDKKKYQLEIAVKKIESLESENSILKSQKYCKWCQKSFSPMISSTKTSSEMEEEHDNKQNYETHHKNNNCQSQISCFEFEKPDLMKLHKKERKGNGKIWIALGILMLVLGLHLHGLNGNLCNQIELNRKETTKWVKQFENKEDGDSFNVKMKFKREEASLFRKVNTEKEKDQFKIRYSNLEYPQVQNSQEEVQINKELLFGIQAEIDDIGLYI